MKPRRKELIAFTLVVNAILGYSQIWQLPAAFSGGFRARAVAPDAQYHVGRDIFEVSPGNYFAGGISTHIVNGKVSYKLTIMGLDGAGQVKWMKMYGDTNLQYLFSPLSTRTFCKVGNFFYYTGPVSDNFSNNTRPYGTLLKFNTNGDTIWQRFYKDPDTDINTQMLCPSTDGNLLITGFFQNWNGGGRSCLLMKVDTNGNELWRKKLHKVFPNVSDGKAIIQDSASGKIVIGGLQYIGDSLSWTTYDHLLILDSTGNILSRINYKMGIICDLIQTRDKKIVIAGHRIHYPINPSYSAFLFKISLDDPLMPIWMIDNYDGIRLFHNAFTSVAELKNGDLLVAGAYGKLTEDNIYMRSPLRILKVKSSDGSILSRKDTEYSMDGSYDNFQTVNCVNLTSDGGWLLSVRSENMGLNPFFYIKSDSLGCDSIEYYCKTVDLGELSSGRGVLKIFPNPVKDRLNVKLENQEPISGLEWQVSDVSGRMVLTGSAGSVQNGVIGIDVKRIEPGIYYFELSDLGKLRVGTRFIRE